MDGTELSWQTMPFQGEPQLSAGNEVHGIENHIKLVAKHKTNPVTDKTAKPRAHDKILLEFIQAASFKQLLRAA